MRAEDTLQFMMDFHGSLFHDRQKCLDQLFCTIGNGYSWVDGELVEDSHDTEILLSRWKLATPIEHAEPTESVSELGRIKEDILKRRNINVDDSKWYPLSKEYSYLYNYPDDIKPDWKALLEECKQMLIDDGIEV